MQYKNIEKQLENQQQMKSELVLEYSGSKYAELLANSIEAEMNKGIKIGDCFDKCYENAEIPFGANFMGNIYHVLIRTWVYGDQLKEYLIQSRPVTSGFIGIK
jgi:F0F1-type ATP synthase beta subunit